MQVIMTSSGFRRILKQWLAGGPPSRPGRKETRMRNWMNGAKWAGWLALAALAGPVGARLAAGAQNPGQPPAGADGSSAANVPVIRRISEAESPLASLEYGLKLTAEQKQ